MARICEPGVWPGWGKSNGTTFGLEAASAPAVPAGGTAWIFGCASSCSMFPSGQKVEKAGVRQLSLGAERGVHLGGALCQLQSGLGDVGVLRLAERGLQLHLLAGREGGRAGDPVLHGTVKAELRAQIRGRLVQRADRVGHSRLVIILEAHEQAVDRGEYVVRSQGIVRVAVVEYGLRGLVDGEGDPGCVDNLASRRGCDQPVHSVGHVEVQLVGRLLWLVTAEDELSVDGALAQPHHLLKDVGNLLRKSLAVAGCFYGIGALRS